MENIIQKFLRIKKVTTESCDLQNNLTHKFSGTVLAEMIDSSTVVFWESITWQSGEKLKINSKNIYRWTFLNSGNIKLEHLRFGENKPVFLSELFQTKKNTWKSIEPHNCNNDLYSAELDMNNENPVLYWKIKGPTENYSLKTVYF